MRRGRKRTWAERLYEVALVLLPALAILLSRAPLVIPRGRLPPRGRRIVRRRASVRGATAQPVTGALASTLTPAAERDLPAVQIRMVDLRERSWRRWRRVLGYVFWAWAFFQLLMSVFAARAGVPNPALFWSITAAAFVAYAWMGLRLMQDGYDARVAPLAGCLLALWQLPVGTVVGLFGLWALLRRRTSGVQRGPGGVHIEQTR